jgi:endogenous inhibitor of DNA gyrase (YacG/DUF329 family)
MDHENTPANRRCTNCKTPLPEGSTVHWDQLMRPFCSPKCIRLYTGIAAYDQPTGDDIDDECEDQQDQD